MSTKKAFVELVSFLKANQNKKVSEVWSEIEQLTESKKAEETMLFDSAGKVTHIFCYYHKQFEDVTKVEYGKKASTKSGLNTMCKVGTNTWTKQQADAKKAKLDVFSKVESGEIKPGDMRARFAEVEATRLAIDTTDMPNGFKTKALIPKLGDMQARFAEAKKPEAKKPEAKKPEAKKPEAKKPEAKKPK